MTGVQAPRGLPPARIERHADTLADVAKQAKGEKAGPEIKLGTY